MGVYLGWGRDFKPPACGLPGRGCLTEPEPAPQQCQNSTRLRKVPLTWASLSSARSDEAASMSMTT